MALLWNAIKEAARAAKGQMSKNARNAAKAEAKKERGPVKAFFHITKNENVPAIEQQGLLTNHPNANINSANHPFRKHGTDAGGVWVTTEPIAFPVYGTTIGGKNGNAAARADALSTFKIEVPLPELRKMRAVQDPYGKNILRKGDDPRAVEKFGTWAGIDVPTTVLLNDVKPQWLKNIGYVEEGRNLGGVATYPEFIDIPSGWGLKPGDAHNNIRALSKGNLKDYSGYTGHMHGMGSYEKSPQRFVSDYIDANQPIANRLPEFPEPISIEYMSRIQGAKNGPKHIWDPDNNSWSNVPALNERERYSTGFIPAREWSEYYQGYVKPGESINSQRSFEFAPGAISRGMGKTSTSNPIQAIYDRNFDWNQYDRLIAEGEAPSIAAHAAAPDYVLDWDNIVYKPTRGYGPEYIPINYLSTGAISRGNDMIDTRAARTKRSVRQLNADRLRHAIKPYNESNANIVRNEYKLDMPDDEIRELSRLEIQNNKDNATLSEGVKNWSQLENSDILKLRQRALDKIKGLWLYDYLTK